MNITAEQVKALRDKTGAGMIDCKKALTEAEGDFEKAIEILRKKGAAVASKRADRTANEGIILTKISDDLKNGLILEINCETDFVAKNDDFKNFAEYALEAIWNKKPANLEEALSIEYKNTSIKNELDALVGKIGEKITVSRFGFLSVLNGIVGDYIHFGSKLGVLVSISAKELSEKDELKLLAKEIAMQIAAMKPGWISRNEVPKEITDKELEIYKDLARKEGKPENILDKIAQGRLNKFYEENCLLEQIYIKDNNKKIQTLIDEYNKKYKSEIKVEKMFRYHVSDEVKQ
jgi:elongation factor Ts